MKIISHWRGVTLLTNRCDVTGAYQNVYELRFWPLYFIYDAAAYRPITIGWHANQWYPKIKWWNQ